LAYLREVSAPQGKPLFTFIHWGLEGHPSPGQREKHLARLMQTSASLIIGHHPHQAGKLETNPNGAIAWSLGNFLFDQPAPQADGALLEVTFFSQGTFWARQIPFGNLYNFTVRGNR
jgi:poly-gamma-glutamate capsule biosynthesis protein CapA/YwtB (metallophosphatase superfamily)